MTVLKLKFKGKVIGVLQDEQGAFWARIQHEIPGVLTGNEKVESSIRISPDLFHHLNLGGDVSITIENFQPTIKVPKSISCGKFTGFIEDENGCMWMMVKCCEDDSETQMKRANAPYIAAGCKLKIVIE